MASAVDGGGLVQLPGDLRHRLAQEEHPEGRGQGGREQGRVGVDDAEVAHLREQRHDEDLQRDHQRRQVEHEDDVAAGEAKPVEGVRGQGAGGDLDRRGDDSDPHAVEEHPPERQRLHQPAVGGDLSVFWPQPGPTQATLGGQGGDDHPPEREQHDHGPDGDRGEDEPTVQRVLNHCSPTSSAGAAAVR